jgi:hypothetical protein
MTRMKIWLWHSNEGLRTAIKASTRIYYALNTSLDRVFQFQQFASYQPEVFVEVLYNSLSTAVIYKSRLVKVAYLGHMFHQHRPYSFFMLSRYSTLRSHIKTPISSCPNMLRNYFECAVIICLPYYQIYF